VQQVTVGGCKFCAFCVHWYDPTNSAIKPIYPASNHWEFDNKAESYCAIHPFKSKRKAFQCCEKWESKV